MNCDGVIRRISSYIDGELETTIVAEIELHLKECPECATLVWQTKLIIHLYHDADLADFPVIWTHSSDSDDASCRPSSYAGAGRSA